MNNVLLNEFKTPYDSVDFNNLKTSDFKPAFDKYIQELRSEIDEIVGNKDEPDFKNTIVALEQAGEKLSRVASILFNLHVAETNDDIQKITQEVSPVLAEIRNEIILNKELFQRIKKVKEANDKTSLSVEDFRLLKTKYEDYVKNGANLDDSVRERYREVTKKLSLLTVKFNDNVLSETNSYILHITNKKELVGIPENIRLSAEQEASERNLKGWAFTLQQPSYIAFMKYADNRKLRKELYTTYNSRGLKDNDQCNIELIKEITNLRMELANILGFETYGHFVLSDRMAEYPEKVYGFIDKLLEASLPFAKNEYEEVQEYANKSGADFTIQPWDWMYYSEKLKQEKYNVHDEITRPYFRLENVESGVFELAKTLFGLSFKENKDIPVYHKDVKVFEVYDENKDFLSLLYMDYFPRTTKKGGAWMTDYKQQHINKKGENIRPHISLVFNFTKPTGKKPSLLTYTEVKTLLHEFGHALHGMLTDCNYESLSGTNVYRDFVELPSQLLENWADEKDWLNKIAVHYKTGEVIPEEMVDNIILAKNFISGYQCTRQLGFAVTDMKWHSLTEPFNGSIIDFERTAMTPTQVLPFVESTAMSTSFSHIFGGGYASGYYSYKWAEVLDADAFEYFKIHGVFNKEIAKEFRDNILSRGGTEHPMDLYVRFRGHEPDIKPLLKRSGLLKDNKHQGTLRSPQSAII